MKKVLLLMVFVTLFICCDVYAFDWNPSPSPLKGSTGSGYTLPTSLTVPKITTNMFVLTNAYGVNQGYYFGAGFDIPPIAPNKGYQGDNYAFNWIRNTTTAATSNYMFLRKYDSANSRYNILLGSDIKEYQPNNTYHFFPDDTVYTESTSTYWDTTVLATHDMAATKFTDTTSNPWHMYLDDTIRVLAFDETKWQTSYSSVTIYPDIVIDTTKGVRFAAWTQMKEDVSNSTYNFNMGILPTTQLNSMRDYIYVGSNVSDFTYYYIVYRRYSAAQATIICDGVTSSGHNGSAYGAFKINSTGYDYFEIYIPYGGGTCSNFSDGSPSTTAYIYCNGRLMAAGIPINDLKQWRVGSGSPSCVDDATLPRDSIYVVNAQAGSVSGVWFKVKEMVRTVIP